MLTAAIGLLLALVALLLWLLPRWQTSVRDNALSTKERMELENEFRKTLVQLVGGIAILAGLYFTWQQNFTAWRSLENIREHQLIERFSRAIDQLASDKLQVRLGAIYTLQRIGSESEHHASVKAILAAFVRDQARWKGEEITRPTRLDVQAALTVISALSAQLPVRLEAKGEAIDLSNTDLRRYSLEGADLNGVLLSRARLEGANLRKVKLEKGRLFEAHLERAQMQEANLRGANLVGAYMERVDLSDADLTNGDLTGADLNGAILENAMLVNATLVEARLDSVELNGARAQGANFCGARGLGAGALRIANFDAETVLPDCRKAGGDGEKPRPADR